MKTKRKPSQQEQSKSAPPKKKRKSEEVKRKEVPPATPHGIPTELLEKILSYVTKVGDICNVEGVNKVFRDLAWKTFTTLDIHFEDDDKILIGNCTKPWRRRGKTIEDLKRAMPNLWNKATNLSRIFLDDELYLQFLGKTNATHFLHLIQKLQYRNPRKITHLRLKHKFGQSTAVANLVNAWSPHLRVIEIARMVDDFGNLREAKRFGVNLAKCQNLESFTLSLDEFSTSNLFTFYLEQQGTGEDQTWRILPSLKHKEHLKELNFRGYHRSFSDHFMTEFLDLLTSMEGKSIDLNLKLTGKNIKNLMDEIFQRNLEDPKFTFVKTLSVMLDDTSLSSQRCQTIFSLFPTAEGISHALCKVLGSFALAIMIKNNTTFIFDVDFESKHWDCGGLVVSFLEAFKESQVSRNLSVHFLYHSDKFWMRDVGSIMVRVRNSLGVVGEMLTDFQDLKDERKRIRRRDFDLGRRITVKFQLGAAVCVIKRYDHHGHMDYLD